MNSINYIQEKSILVIGDVMLDTYYQGDVSRISPEAPVPIFLKKNEHSVLGGAANVAANLVAAGQKVFMMTIIGKDEAGNKLRSILEAQGIDTSLVFVLDRKTTVKTRFLANNNQQVLRLDIEDRDDITIKACNEMLAKLEEKVNKFDLVLLSDYLKGLLTHEFTQGVLQMAKKRNIPAIIDVKDPQINKYRDAYLIKPNLKELGDLTGMKTSSDKEIIEASEQLRQICNCRYILTTCGARGMVLVGDDEPYFIESVDQKVFDVTGAGDTTIAYLAVCMVNGFNIRRSVDISNYAAGIQVSKVGTSTVYWSEIRDFLSDRTKGTSHKLISGKSIDEFRKSHFDKKIVFTNGCFDILHIGHIRYLQKAADLGDILVLGLNSDASVKRLKGPKRPINTELDRAEILCAFGFIDYIVIFDEDTPYELIKKIQPDVLVKGGDYKPDEVIGKDIVEARGGQLVLIPFVEGKSSTKIIKKMDQ